MEKGNIKAYVDMFGRDTLIDLEFSDIEEIQYCQKQWEGKPESPQGGKLWQKKI